MKIRKGNASDEPSDYETGKTELTTEQEDKISEISRLVMGFPNNYDRLHLSYSPQGILDILRDQIALKVNQQEINETERQLAQKAKEELKILFGI